MSTKGSRRKPGLWFSARKIEVEDVTSRQSKGCKDCGKLPTHRRLKVVNGSGRHGVTEIRCVECGEAYLKRMCIEAERAISYLNGPGSVVSVRL